MGPCGNFYSILLFIIFPVKFSDFFINFIFYWKYILTSWKNPEVRGFFFIFFWLLLSHQWREKKKRLQTCTFPAFAFFPIRAAAFFGLFTFFPDGLVKANKWKYWICFFLALAKPFSQVNVIQFGLYFCWGQFRGLLSIGTLKEAFFSRNKRGNLKKDEISSMTCGTCFFFRCHSNKIGFIHSSDLFICRGCKKHLQRMLQIFFSTF